MLDLVSPIGLIVALASVIDARANRRTRALALVALCPCILYFAIVLARVLTHQKSGERDGPAAPGRTRGGAPLA